MAGALARLTGVFSLPLAAGLVAAGCSSDSGPSGASCSSANDCTEWSCVCKDNTQFSTSSCVNHACADQSICDSGCANHGGLVSVAPKQTVKDSPECAAFCAKAESLGCGSTCNEVFFCGLDPGDCPESKRAYLQCEVDTGTWKCESGGWSITSSCSKQSCASDAGSD